MSWGNGLSSAERSVAAISGLERKGWRRFVLPHDFPSSISLWDSVGGFILEVHAEVKFPHSVLLDSTER